ncbi:unnamed protein product [Sympodiomycopsis kandeliae]
MFNRMRRKASISRHHVFDNGTTDSASANTSWEDGSSSHEPDDTVSERPSYQSRSNSVSTDQQSIRPSLLQHRSSSIEAGFLRNNSLFRRNRQNNNDQQQRPNDRNNSTNAQNTRGHKSSSSTSLPFRRPFNAWAPPGSSTGLFRARPANQRQHTHAGNTIGDDHRQAQQQQQQPPQHQEVRKSRSSALLGDRFKNASGGSPAPPLPRPKHALTKADEEDLFKILSTMSQRPAFNDQRSGVAPPRPRVGTPPFKRPPQPVIQPSAVKNEETYLNDSLFDGQSRGLGLTLASEQHPQPPQLPRQGSAESQAQETPPPSPSRHQSGRHVSLSPNRHYRIYSEDANEMTLQSGMQSTSARVSGSPVRRKPIPTQQTLRGVPSASSNDGGSDSSSAASASHRKPSTNGIESLPVHPFMRSAPHQQSFPPSKTKMEILVPADFSSSSTSSDPSPTSTSGTSEGRRRRKTSSLGSAQNKRNYNTTGNGNGNQDEVHLHASRSESSLDAPTRTTSPAVPRGKGLSAPTPFKRGSLPAPDRRNRRMTSAEALDGGLSSQDGETSRGSTAKATCNGNLKRKGGKRDDSPHSSSSLNASAPLPEVQEPTSENGNDTIGAQVNALTDAPASEQVQDESTLESAQSGTKISPPLRLSSLKPRPEDGSRGPHHLGKSPDPELTPTAERFNMLDNRHALSTAVTPRLETIPSSIAEETAPEDSVTKSMQEEDMFQDQLKELLSAYNGKIVEACDLIVKASRDANALDRRRSVSLILQPTGSTTGSDASSPPSSVQRQQSQPAIANGQPPNTPGNFSTSTSQSTLSKTNLDRAELPPLITTNIQQLNDTSFEERADLLPGLMIHLVHTHFYNEVVERFCYGIQNAATNRNASQLIEGLRSQASLLDLHSLTTHLYTTLSNTTTPSTLKSSQSQTLTQLQSHLSSLIYWTGLCKRKSEASMFMARAYGRMRDALMVLLDVVRLVRGGRKVDVDVKMVGLRWYEIVPRSSDERGGNDNSAPQLQDEEHQQTDLLRNLTTHLQLTVTTVPSGICQQTTNLPSTTDNPTISDPLQERKQSTSGISEDTLSSSSSSDLSSWSSPQRSEFVKSPQAMSISSPGPRHGHDGQGKEMWTLDMWIRHGARVNL